MGTAAFEKYFWIQNDWSWQFYIHFDLMKAVQHKWAIGWWSKLYRITKEMYLL